MSLEGADRSVEKGGHPVLLAVAVLAIVLVAATAYTFAGSLAPSPHTQVAGGSAPQVGPTQPVDASGRDH